MGVLEGKSVIVTGAGSGIGRAAAQLFASEGASVLAAEINEAPGQETVDLITAAGNKAIFRKVDVSKASEVEAMVNDAVSEFGKLDVLLNNAGILGETGLKIADSTLENWDRIISVNLNSVYYGMKYAIPALIANGGGNIVSIASVAGLVAVPNLAAYAASKGGIVQLTRTAAIEYAENGIRINAICPGGVDTNISSGGLTPDTPRERPTGDRSNNPSGRSADPEEIAAAALFLASDASSYVTGVCFPVDGGHTAQ